MQLGNIHEIQQVVRLEKLLNEGLLKLRVFPSCSSIATAAFSVNSFLAIDDLALFDILVSAEALPQANCVSSSLSLSGPQSSR